MPLTTGTHLGPYEIVAPLGAGGMGEVYRARDTRLNRTVAIKVSPSTSRAIPRQNGASNERRRPSPASIIRISASCTTSDMTRGWTSW